MYLAFIIRDFPAIKKAINLLEKGMILNSEKVNKQKTIKRLTDLGKEIISLLDNIEFLNKTFSRLQNSVINYNQLMTEPEEILRSKLLYRGWKKGDVESFYDIVNLFDIFIQIYVSNVCNLLLQRFISIASTFKVKDMIKNILIKIIMDEIVRQFEIIAKIKSVSIAKDDPKRTDPDFQTTIRSHHSHTYHNLLLSFLDQVDRLYALNYLPTDTKLQSDLNNLVKSMILLSKPSKQYLQFKHDRIRSRRFDQLEDEYSKQRKVYSENSSILASIYNELIISDT